jgi:hypothetical protein
METDKNYLIRVQAGNKLLTYSAFIISLKNNFVTFKDKFGAIYSYNLNTIVSYEEIEGERK